MQRPSCGRLSNKPLEWTGRRQSSASPPQAPCLPLRGSVRRIAACALEHDVEGIRSGVPKQWFVCKEKSREQAKRKKVASCRAL